jgi:hypothetical protein
MRTLGAIRAALSAVIWFSIADGINTSTGCSIQASPGSTS